MTFFIKPLAKFIAALNSNARPGEVAAAVSFAFLLALMPSFNLLWPCLFIVSLLFRINWAFEFVFIALFKWVVPLIDPVIEPFGWRILQSGAVSGLVYRINTVPGLSFLGLNDSLMIGGIAAGVAAWLPVFFLVRFLIIIFRKRISPRIAGSRFAASVKKVPFLGQLITAVQQFSEAY